MASRASRSALGIFAKAASVGANTVNGPGPFRVSTRPAALSAVASVLNCPAETAVSTMSLAQALDAISAEATTTSRDFFIYYSLNRFKRIEDEKKNETVLLHKSK